MRRKVLDGTLLLAALVGMFLVWQDSREQGRLRAGYERLTRMMGVFPITDPSKIHVLALDTGEPMHFAWRVYLPANYELLERVVPASVVASAFSSSPRPSREIIVRVRFRQDARGRLILYQKLEDHSSRGEFGSKALGKVLNGRFDKVVVERLGARKFVTVGVDEPLDLLRLKLPADMDAEILKLMSPSERADYDPEFFAFSFGPEAKKPPATGAGD